MPKSSPTTPQTGWIGLGSQGGPMARVLAEAGIPTRLWARRPEALDAYRDTPATYASSAAELLAEVDVLFVCVRDDQGVRELLLGSAQRPPVASMRAGSTVVIHSTIHPDLAVEVEREAAKHGVTVVDAPVSGGGQAAESRSLLVMTAGPDDAVARVKPLLETYGDPIPHLGPVGAGQRAKLINNLLLTANMAVAESAFALGKALGVDPESLHVVLANGTGRSYGLALVRGNDHDLKPAAVHAGPLLRKDARLLAELAEASGVKPGTVLEAADAALESMGLPR